MRGESSPNYTTYPHHLGIPERMHEVVPDAKLIFLVRDPLERIAAHWVHNYAKRRESGDLRETLLHPNTTYVLRSKYHVQLRQFLNHYACPRSSSSTRTTCAASARETLREVFDVPRRRPGLRAPQLSPRAPPHDPQAPRDRARRSRSSRCAGRLSARACRRRSGTRSTSAVLGSPIPRPDVRGALGPEVIEVLHEDADRLRELTGRSFESWSV